MINKNLFTIAIVILITVISTLSVSAQGIRNQVRSASSLQEAKTLLHYFTTNEDSTETKHFVAVYTVLETISEQYFQKNLDDVNLGADADLLLLNYLNSSSPDYEMLALLLAASPNDLMDVFNQLTLTNANFQHVDESVSWFDAPKLLSLLTKNISTESLENVFYKFAVIFGNFEKLRLSNETENLKNKITAANQEKEILFWKGRYQDIIIPFYRDVTIPWKKEKEEQIALAPEDTSLIKKFLILHAFLQISPYTLIEVYDEKTFQEGEKLIELYTTFLQEGDKIFDLHSVADHFNQYATIRHEQFGGPVQICTLNKGKVEIIEVHIEFEFEEGN